MTLSAYNNIGLVAFFGPTLLWFTSHSLRNLATRQPGIQYSERLFDSLIILIGYASPSREQRNVLKDNICEDGSLQCIVSTEDPLPVYQVRAGKRCEQVMGQMDINTEYPMQPDRRLWWSIPTSIRRLVIKSPSMFIRFETGHAA